MRGQYRHLTCFPFHPQREKTAADTLQPKRLPPKNAAGATNYIGTESNPGGVRQAQELMRKHLQNRPLFLDAKEKLQHSVAVEAEFNSLDIKVAQVVDLCERLRVENVDLRRQLAAALGEARQLGEKVEGAKTRLEQLLVRIPD